MLQKTRIVLGLAAVCALLLPATSVYAQGVTTSSITGTVNDPQGLPVPGATVVAVHEPSGTKYEAITLSDGRYSIDAMRVGGPYTVTASLAGFQDQVTKDIYLNLGIARDVVLVLKALALAESVTVVGTFDPIFSSNRTGAGTAVSLEAIQSLPTISNRIDSFVRLVPQAGAGLSFAGTDARLNNITVDGSSFNNSFGLASAPGERTNVSPISVNALEQVQVNIAPFDVRQGNFVGAGVNSVTKSGTNQYHGSGFYQFRTDSMVGTKPGANTYDPGSFDFKNYGGWLGGPVVKNRLFFFFSLEHEGLTQPGTTYKANKGGETVAGNITRVLASDLDTLSSFLKTNFNYETGPYQDYDHVTPATRVLAKVDFNINNRNKLSLRYNQLDSVTDVLLSNSSSLGYGSRRSSQYALNFKASNYRILENIRSFIGELDTTFGSNMANSLIAGYTYQDESRPQPEGVGLFPFVDILDAGRVYTSFGFEPFTPNNELRYGTLQIQDNFTMYRAGHTLTVGGSFERYRSENVYFPGAQSVYVYNSLADFYTDANDSLANPNRTTSPVQLRRFQVRWMNMPDMEKPIQPLHVYYTGAYAQDVWQVRSNVKLTYGLRFDVPIFGDTAFANANADALTFRDEKGNPVQYSTGKLPGAKILWSPRVGFNWAVDSERNTQVRGGTGIFTGRPAYVWVSNQIGNTGVLTGFEAIDYTSARPFNPDPNRYKPTNVTGAPASSYELAVTDPDFKFPQVWRTSIGVDQRLPGGWSASFDLLYSRDVNGLYYINSNLAAPNTAFTGADTRPRWSLGGTSNRINPLVANNIVLKNQSVGRATTVSASIEKTFRAGFWVKGGYRYGVAKNTVDPGSVAFGSWNNNQHQGDPNNPGLAYSTSSPGHRVFATASYSFDYLNFGATTVAVFLESYTDGSFSYTFTGDLNGDGGTSNDLIYIPRNTSEMNFQQFSSSGVTFTPDAQASAWEAYIAQDAYLSQHRGEYAVRGAKFMPMVFRADISVTQELFKNLGGMRHALQLRADVLNLPNLLNHNWGVGNRYVTATPLSAQGADSQGRAQYRLQTVTVGGVPQLLSKTIEPSAGASDVWRIQVSLRYTF